MEGIIEKFLSVSFGYGDGLGSGLGSGLGFGLGFGLGSASGYGDGGGSGFGDDGGGSGSAYGFGIGEGDGSGSGSGSGFGFGFGDGDGSGIIEFEGQKVWYIDGIPTIIKKIRHNVAKGFILKRNLTLLPCYIAKVENSFAHAPTIKEAVRQAAEKAFQNLPVEKRIEEFWKYHNDKIKYPARDLWIWHNKLTGSCEMGRNQFAAERGIDIDNDSFTVEEFYQMCKNEYGGEIIEQMYELRG